jgi:hypothetical protein
MNHKWLMLFKKITGVYSENHMKLIYTICGQNSESVNINCMKPRPSHVMTGGQPVSLSEAEARLNNI